MHEAHRNDDGWRLSAGNLEKVVISSIRSLLGDISRLIDLLHLDQEHPTELKQLMSQSESLRTMLVECEHAATLNFLQNVVLRIDLSRDEIGITVDPIALATALNAGNNQNNPSSDGKVNITVPVTLRRRGVEAKLVIAGNDNDQRQPNHPLCQLIAMARHWYDQLASGGASSVRAIAKRDGLVESEVTRILPLAFLSPRIIESVLEGRQPEGMNVERLKRLSPLPGDWKTQAKLVENFR